jgi:hypothetical protein
VIIISQNSKRLPKNSLTLILAFNDSGKLDEFMESEEYKQFVSDIESVANKKYGLRKVEKIPYKT